MTALVLASFAAAWCLAMLGRVTRLNGRAPVRSSGPWSGFGAGAVDYEDDWTTAGA